MNGLDIGDAHPEILQYFLHEHDGVELVRFRLTATSAGLYSESLLPARAWCRGRSAKQVRPSSNVDPDKEAGDPNSTVKRAAGRIFHPEVGQLPSPSPSANLVGQAEATMNPHSLVSPKGNSWTFVHLPVIAN
jgi:hypothetical protein